MPCAGTQDRTRYGVALQSMGAGIGRRALTRSPLERPVRRRCTHGTAWVRAQTRSCCTRTRREAAGMSSSGSGARAMGHAEDVEHGHRDPLVTGGVEVEPIGIPVPPVAELPHSPEVDQGCVVLVDGCAEQFVVEREPAADRGIDGRPPGVERGEHDQPCSGCGDPVEGGGVPLHESVDVHPRPHDVVGACVDRDQVGSHCERRLELLAQDAVELAAADRQVGIGEIVGPCGEHLRHPVGPAANPVGQSRVEVPDAFGERVAEGDVPMEAHGDRLRAPGASRHGCSATWVVTKTGVVEPKWGRVTIQRTGPEFPGEVMNRSRAICVVAGAAALALTVPASASGGVSDPIATGLAGPLQFDVGHVGQIYVGQSFAGVLTKVRPNGTTVDLAGRGRRGHGRRLPAAHRRVHVRRRNGGGPRDAPQGQEAERARAHAREPATVRGEAQPGCAQDVRVPRPDRRVCGRGSAGNRRRALHGHRRVESLRTGECAPGVVRRGCGRQRDPPRLQLRQGQGRQGAPCSEDHRHRGDR